MYVGIYIYKCVAFTILYFICFKDYSLSSLLIIYASLVLSW